MYVDMYVYMSERM